MRDRLHPQGARERPSYLDVGTAIVIDEARRAQEQKVALFFDRVDDAKIKLAVLELGGLLRRDGDEDVCTVVYHLPGTPQSQ